ncbi:hypothetical protein ES705_47997 [subsurface metagenome]
MSFFRNYKFLYFLNSFLIIYLVDAHLKEFYAAGQNIPSDNQFL